MDDGAKEIAYDILQHEYLKRRNVPMSEENFGEIMKLFPFDWFTYYSLDKRIEIISMALKNNIDIEEALEINQKSKIG